MLLHRLLLACVLLLPAAAQAGACAGGAAWCRGQPWIVTPPAAQAVAGEPRQTAHGEDVPGGAIPATGAPSGSVALVSAAEAATATAGAYFVEARFRPMPGAVGQGYAIVRYADDRNWLGFGLDVVSGGGRVAVNIVRMVDGQPKFLKQVRTEPSQGNAFYTIRLDVDGAALTAYLNGARLIGVNEPNPLPPRIGVLAQGGTFEIDGLRAGDITQPPTSIGLVHRHRQLTLQAGEAAQRYEVRAMSRVGLSTLRFSAAASDPGVAAVSVEGHALVLAPRAEGTSAVTLTAADDPNIAVTLAVRVGPAFATSTRRYPLPRPTAQPAAPAAPAPAASTLSDPLARTMDPAAPPAASAVQATTRAGPASAATTASARRDPPAHAALQPGPRERDVPPDTRLQVHFDSAPTISANGSIRIVRAADGKTVDIIRPGMELDEIGATPDGIKRVVRYQAITADGATVTIRPHDGKLAYGTDYYILLDGNIFSGAKLAGQQFDGIGKRAGWTFRTRDRAPQATSLRVAPAGKADFRTVQGALNHVMQRIPRAQPVTVTLANGRHEGLLYLRGKDNLTLRGESRSGAVIAAENSDGVNPGSGAGQSPLAPGAGGGRSVFLVEDADLLRLDTLTLVNTTMRSKTIGAQAEALYFNSEGRLIASQVDFFSEQDTIQVKGYAWFYRSLVAGNVDFIWGYNRAALFEESEIRSVGDSANPASGGYLVQARTVAEDDPGFVFLNSHLTHGPGPAGNDVPAGATYLARPGVVTAWDNVRYINCRIGPHINPKGWSEQPRGGKGWEEAGSTGLSGEPIELSARRGGRVLPAAEAARYDSRAKVFSQYDNGKGWNPQP
ncbi:pectinesterase family protein [Pseudoduganella sp. OTU4001]|uniref:pectinesterase family protein n=1 Tax=Pseudoduganella sp. OTU4001 TaxID=3043854 RepID=UPI00313E2BD1